MDHSKSKKVEAMEGKDGKINAAVLPHPLHEKQKNFRKIRVKINKTLSNQAQLQTAIKAEALKYRRARTRSLIQVGGLLSLSGLLQICQIDEGEDLQLDIDSLDKAATLLGILIDTVDTIPDPPDAGQMETWRESGTRLLKQRAAQVTYQKRRETSQKMH